MQKSFINLVYGCLLHDIGKVIHRCGEQKNHSILGKEFLKTMPQFASNSQILDCVAYHHGRELHNAKVEDDSLAYICYIADNISAFSDRREGGIEGEEESKRLFDIHRPLASVFNILNGNNQNYNYSLEFLKEINNPSENIPNYTQSQYIKIKSKISEQLKGIDVNQNNINSLLHLLEVCTSYIPSSTKLVELSDISLFDHAKTTAAIASCIYYYMQGQNLKEALLKNSVDFYNQNSFLMFSFDVSGIQSFIYTISDKSTLKALRARSLYLELLIENIVDDFLSLCGLIRCNLIYSGGGHAYILLPNTEDIKQKIAGFQNEIKQWFLSKFDISLYLASAYVPCTGNELAHNVGSVYEKLSKELSNKKAQRYSYTDIIDLNTFKYTKHQRECRECKKSGEVSSDGMCSVCDVLISISPNIIKNDLYFVTQKCEDKSYLPLPFGNKLSIKTLEQARQSEYIRIYSKNQPSLGENFATNIWVGDYYPNIKGELMLKTFEEFANDSVGIKRLAVLRADVDNLGKAFIGGFKQKDTSKQNIYETISRTATLSR